MKMEGEPAEDTNYQAKRKIDETDVEDEGAAVKRPKASGSQLELYQPQEDDEYNLLHFSDDVMLHILQYCSPLELKALSFCCRRLARLCMDRSLWRDVDLRQQASGSRALSFYVHCLRSSTNSFYIRGLIGAGSVKSDSSKGAKKQSVPVDCHCFKSDFIGIMRKRMERNPFSRAPIDEDEIDEPPPNEVNAADEEKKNKEQQGKSGSSKSDDESVLIRNEDEIETFRRRSGIYKANKKLLNWLASSDDESYENEAGSSSSDANQAGPSSSYSPGKSHKENGNTSPKPFSAAYEDYPSITDTPNSKREKSREKNKDSKRKKHDVAECCRNKAICLATITKDIMIEINQRCSTLRDLRLEYCNLDCNSFPITEFPKNLKVLSLKGCKRTNMPFQKTYVFKIQDHLVSLEELDLSYCSWLSGHSLLLLSKMRSLKKLWLRGCTGLGECVAYASLSTRFGFKTLELLDVRGTSMGDSEVSGFGCLESLRELYLEPPRRDSTQSNPVGWAEHSGLMEFWETKHPNEEVEEYIKMMNADELLSKQMNNPPESSNEPGTSSKDADKQGKKSTENNDNRPNDDAGPSAENIGLFYRSVVNLSYQERIPVELQNDDQQRPNNNNANQDGQRLPNGPRQPERNPENPMDVHLGPLGVQVGPLGVQVGPLRVQMRQRPDLQQQPPAGEGQPGMGGVQVGPVEVQVGPDGVQVGLGGVRVDPGWARGGPEAGVQVELGGVRVDPGWMEFGPAGVQVGFGGVQVGPGQPPEDGRNGRDGRDPRDGRDGRDARDARDGPVEVQVGPIEVQVGAVRVEMGQEGRRLRDFIYQHHGDGQRPPAPPPEAAEERANVNANPNPREPRAQNRLHDYPMDYPGMRFNPFWMQMDGGNDNPINEQMMEMNPVGVHVHLRHAHRHGRRHREREQGENPPNDGGQPNNDPQVNPLPLLADPPAERPPDRRPLNWIHVEPDVVRVALGEGQGPRGVVIAPGYRVGNYNVRPRPGPRIFVENMAGEFIENHPFNPQENDEARGVNAGDRENPNNARYRDVENRNNAHRENPEAPRENNDNNRQPNRDRPSIFRRVGDLYEPPNAPNVNPPNANEQARQELHHNIMDGRVHVIYVDPRFPRRPAAEVLVAAGMPRNAEVMIHDDGPVWPPRQEFHLRDLPQIFDVPLIQLPFLNVGGNLRHLDGTELVTDVSLLRLGESEQLVHVGGNHSRRRRSSNLEVLVCRGYRGVTDQSLIHLAAAAPALRHLDVEDCGVTAAGVAAFAMHRPDCKLHHNVIQQPAEERNNDPQ